MSKRTEIDHIDPRWEEGRDYQLVCGLDVAANFCERPWKANNSKSNRFLPYRGSAPVDPGEFHWFLNLETGEWEWQEFLGTWWFEQTRSLCGPAEMGRRAAAGWLRSPEVVAKQAASLKNRVFTEEHRAKLSEARSKALKERSHLKEQAAANGRKNKGRKHTDAAKEKIGAAFRGKPWSQARRDAHNKRYDK